MSLGAARGTGNTGHNVSTVSAHQSLPGMLQKKQGKKREAAADVYLQHNIRTRDMELKASYSSGFI